MSKLLNLTPENFEQEVLKSKTPVLVDFWTPWCGPCQMLDPVIEELARDFGEKLKIAKLNVGEPENQELADKYQILSVPIIKIFKNGKVVKEIIGLKSKETLKQEIESINL
jgi:thioredoxin 1